MINGGKLISYKITPLIETAFNLIEKKVVTKIMKVRNCIRNQTNSKEILLYFFYQNNSNFYLTTFKFALSLRKGILSLERLTHSLTILGKIALVRQRRFFKNKSIVPSRILLNNVQCPELSISFI